MALHVLTFDHLCSTENKCKTSVSPHLKFESIKIKMIQYVSLPIVKLSFNLYKCPWCDKFCIKSCPVFVLCVLKKAIVQHDKLHSNLTCFSGCSRLHLFVCDPTPHSGRNSARQEHGRPTQLPMPNQCSTQTYPWEKMVCFHYFQEIWLKIVQYQK